MSFYEGYRCDNCAEMLELHPDEGPPKDWWYLIQMKTNGGWDTENELHFCVLDCLQTYASKMTKSDAVV